MATIESVLQENRIFAPSAEFVAKAPADGYTLLINNISLAINATASSWMMTALLGTNVPTPMA